MRNLSIKHYRIYVCYTNITLYVAFGVIRGSRNRGRSWNILPADMAVRLYIYWAWLVRVLTAVLYVRRADTATLWIDQLFVFSLHSLLMSPATAPTASGSVCSHHCPFLLVCVLCVSDQLLQYSEWTVGFVTKDFLWSFLSVLCRDFALLCSLLTLWLRRVQGDVADLLWLLWSYATRTTWTSDANVESCSPL